MNIADIVVISLDIILHLYGESLPHAPRPMLQLPPEDELQGEAFLAVFNVLQAEVALLAVRGKDVEGDVVVVSVEDDAFSVGVD